LLTQMGAAVVTDDFPEEILEATLNADYRALVAQLNEQ
jgi:3-dehydroquinate synthase